MDGCRRTSTTALCAHCGRSCRPPRPARRVGPLRRRRDGGAGAMTGHDPIDEYLDALLGRLRGDPSTVRRILTEAESHLRDAVDAGATAEVAIARFGDVDIIATHLSPSRPWGRLARELVVVAWLLGSLGLAAVGVSGVIAGAMDLAAGPRFVAG